MICGDGKLRTWIAMLYTWQPDHMDNVNIHGIKTNRCPVCIASLQQLGIPPKNPLPYHNHADYDKLYQARDMGRYVYLLSSESCNQNRVNILAA